MDENPREFQQLAWILAGRLQFIDSYVGSEGCQVVGGVNIGHKLFMSVSGKYLDRMLDYVYLWYVSYYGR
jgi:hypothetical protein